MGEILRDRFGRPMVNLRVSVTQRCGFACSFCHAEGQLSSEDVVTPEAIETVAKVGREFGIREAKLSGGEPTLRHELPEIIERVKRWIPEVSMVTAGYTLPAMAGRLKDAGLDRVNISVHSPDDGTHARVMGSRILDKVKRGIAEAKAVGLGPVRLNMTVMKGVNDAHWRDMIRFSAEFGVDLRIIEIHAPREEMASPYFRQFFTPIDGIEKELAAMAVRKVRRPMHNRPQYLIPPEKSGGDPVEVEVVRPQFNPAFCAGCSRVRLTADGKLKTCLLRRDDYIGIEECHGPHDGASALVVTEESARRAFEKALEIREPYWKSGETYESALAALEAAAAPLPKAGAAPLRVID